MIITCPSCKLSKEMEYPRIPDGGVTATCPRCHARFDVGKTLQPVRLSGRYKLLIMMIVVLSVAALILLHDWKLDKNYFLEPGVWQGEMTYIGKKHPFELVIETAQDGNLAGYMDWVETSPRYRLAIRGTYEGNHLVFVDYAFLERKGAAGLYDEQDVYIIDNEMKGTAKNGAATLTALKRASAPF